MVRIKRIGYLFIVSITFLVADTTTDDVKFIFESGIESFNYKLKSDSNIFESNTEGANLYKLGLKFNVYDSDIFEFSKYSSMSSSKRQKDLLHYYEENRKKEPFFEGYYLSMQLFALYDYFFSTHNTLGNEIILDYRKNTYLNNITTLNNIVYRTKGFSKESKFQTRTDDELYRFGVSSKSGKVNKSSHWMSSFFGSYVYTEGYLFKKKYNRPIYTGISAEGVDFIDDAEINTYGLSIKISPQYKFKNGTLYSIIGWDFSLNDFMSEVEFYNKKYDSKYSAFHIGGGGNFEIFHSTHLDAFIDMNLFYTSQGHTFENTDIKTEIMVDDQFYGGNINLKLVF